MRKPLNIGMMDRRIDLKQPSQTRDAVYNQPINTFSTVATVWSSRKYNKGSEKFVGEKETEVSKYTYYIKYDSSWAAINTTWIITDDSQDYQIVNVQGDKRDYFIIEAVVKE